jgi:hypothetical protein
MNRRLLGCALALFAVGCDDGHSRSDDWSPQMSSFANEFNFDPLRGPVRAFSETVVDQNGETVRHVSARLSREGCFNSLEFHDLQNDSNASLQRQEDMMVDADSGVLRVLLQGHCQLGSLPDASVDYRQDRRGFVTSVQGPQVAIHYRYDEEGYPLGNIARENGERTAVRIAAGESGRKPDYTAVSERNGREIATTHQRCDYDGRGNPTTCRLTSRDLISGVEQRYIISNSIGYY